MEKYVNIGLIGCGTVGAGVARTLLDKSRMLKNRIGSRVVLKKVCDADIRRLKKIKIPSEKIVRDARSIIKDPDINVVVELIGGIHPAKDFILEAMKRGKHVVTANKALIAQEGSEIFEAADRYGVDVYFEASVGGGIPIIKSLRESLVSNELDAILGIVNGTSNYLLTRMKEKQVTFHEALLEAKQHGYAERNPSLDVDGHDASHKLAILALLGFGTKARLSQIHTEGISQVSLSDIQYADELGYCIKPLAIAKEVDGELEMRVHPAFLSKNHLLANVNGVYNGIYVHGDMVGAQLFYGRGAGQGPAASSVVSDIVDVARNVSFGVAKRIPSYIPAKKILKIRRMDDIETRYYMRFTVIDKPGVLAKISGVLGRFDISIASVHQKERRAARNVPVVIMTHEAYEANVRRALKIIDSLDIIKSKTVALRTEAPRGK